MHFPLGNVDGATVYARYSSFCRIYATARSLVSLLHMRVQRKDIEVNGRSCKYNMDDTLIVAILARSEIKIDGSVMSNPPGTRYRDDAGCVT